MDGDDSPEGWDVEDDWAGPVGANDAGDEDLNWPDDPDEEPGPDLLGAPSHGPRLEGQVGMAEPAVHAVPPHSAASLAAAAVPSVPHAAPLMSPVTAKDASVSSSTASHAAREVVHAVPAAGATQPSATSAAAPAPPCDFQAPCMTTVAASAPSASAGLTPASGVAAATAAAPLNDAPATAAPPKSAFQNHATANAACSADPAAAAAAAASTTTATLALHGKPPTGPSAPAASPVKLASGLGTSGPASVAARPHTASPQPAGPGTSTGSPLGMARTPSSRMLAAPGSMGHARRLSSMSNSGAAAAIAAATGVSMEHAASIGWGGSEASYTYSMGLSEAMAASDGEFDAALADLMQETSDHAPHSTPGRVTLCDAPEGEPAQPHSSNDAASSTQLKAAATTPALDSAPDHNGGAARIHLAEPMPPAVAPSAAVAAAAAPVAAAAPGPSELQATAVGSAAADTAAPPSTGFVVAAVNPFGDASSGGEEDDFFGNIPSPAQPAVHIAAPAEPAQAHPQPAVQTWVPATAPAPWDSPGATRPQDPPANAPATEFTTVAPAVAATPSEATASPHTQVQQRSNLADLFGGSSEHEELFGVPGASDPFAGIQDSFGMAGGATSGLPAAPHHVAGSAAPYTDYAVTYDQSQQPTSTSSGHGSFGGYQQAPATTTATYEHAQPQVLQPQQHFSGFTAAPASHMFGGSTQDDGSSFFDDMGSHPQHADPFSAAQPLPTHMPPSQQLSQAPYQTHQPDLVPPAFTQMPQPHSTQPSQPSAAPVVSGACSQPWHQAAPTSMYATTTVAAPPVHPQQPEQAGAHPAWLSTAAAAPQPQQQQQQTGVSTGWATPTSVYSNGTVPTAPPQTAANAWQQPQQQATSVTAAATPAFTAPAAPAWQDTDPSSFFDSLQADTGIDGSAAGAGAFDSGAQPQMAQAAAPTTQLPLPAPDAAPGPQISPAQPQAVIPDPTAPGPPAVPGAPPPPPAPAAGTGGGSAGQQAAETADTPAQARAMRRVFGATRPPSRLSATGYPNTEDDGREQGQEQQGRGSSSDGGQAVGGDTGAPLAGPSVSYGGWLTEKPDQLPGTTSGPFANTDSPDASFFDGFGDAPDTAAPTSQDPGGPHGLEAATPAMSSIANPPPAAEHQPVTEQLPQQEQQQEQQELAGAAEAATGTSDQAAAGAAEGAAGSAEQAAPMTPEQIHQWAEYYAQYYCSQYGQEYYSYYYQMYHDQYTQQAAQAAQAAQQQQQQQQQQAQVQAQAQIHAQAQAWGSQQQSSTWAANASAPAISPTAATSPQAGRASPFSQWQQSTPQQASNAWGGQAQAGVDAWDAQRSLTSPVASATQPAVSPTAWNAAQQEAAPWGVIQQQQQQQGFLAPGAAQQAQPQAAAGYSMLAHAGAGMAPAQGNAWGGMAPAYGAPTNNLYSQQYSVQHKVYAPGSLVELPVSHQAARMCPNGRPGCPVVCFGFGGRVVVVRGALESTASAGEPSGMVGGVGAPPGLMNGLLITTTANLSAALAASQLLGGAQMDHAGGILGGSSGSDVAAAAAAKKPREDPMQRLLTSFPGPLTPSTSRDKLIKVLRERATAYAGEDAHAGQEPPEHGQLLWQVLGVMVSHGGHLRTPPGRGPARPDDPSSPESELVRVLSSHRDDPTAAGNSKGSGSSGGGAGPGGLLSGWVLPSRPSNTNIGTGGVLNPAAAGPAGGSGGGAVHMGGAGPLVLATTQDDARALAGAAEVQRLVVQGRRRDALKVATDSGLWGIALLLATACGGTSFTDTATAMAQASLQPGTPLRTLSLVLAGRPELAVHAAQPEQHGPAGWPHAGGMGLGLGHEHGDGQAALLASWRDNLAVLAGAARGPPDLEAIARLGDSLKVEGAQPLAAQLCYLVAGVAPVFNDGGATRNPRTSNNTSGPPSSSQVGAAVAATAGAHRYCLLGVDHALATRTYAHALSVQRTEVLEWARVMAGGAHGAQGSGPAAPGGSDPGSAGGVLLPLQPYKLLYAQLLAEYGHVPEALAYCQVVEGVLRGGSGGPGAGGAPRHAHPPSFALLLRELEETKERLVAFAQAHAINVGRAESSITKIGRFLDGTLTKLLWGSEPSGSSNTAGATGGTAAAGGSLPGRVGGAVEVWGGPSAPVAPLQLSPGVLPRAASSNNMPRTMSTASSIGNPAAYQRSGPPSHGHRRESSQGQDFSGFGVSGPHSHGTTPGTPHQMGLQQMPASGAAAPGGWGAHTGQGQMQVPGGPGYNSYSSSQQGGGPSRGHSRAPSEGPWDAVSNIGDGGNSHLPGGGGVGGAMAQAGYDAARAPRVSGPAASGPPSVTSPGLPSLPAAPSQKRTGQGQQGAQGQQQQQQQALGVSGQAGQQDAPKSQGRSGWRLLGLFAGGESSKQESAAGASKKASLGEENKFFFDKSKGRWVMEGQEELAEPPPPAAPPTSFGTGAATGAMGAAAPGPGVLPGAGVGGGPPGVGGSGPPSTGSGAIPTNLQRGKGMRNRYVDVFNTSSSGASRAASQSGLDSLVPGLLPPGPAISSSGPGSVGGASMHSASSLLPAGSASFSAQPQGFFTPATSFTAGPPGGGAGGGGSLYAASFAAAGGAADAATSFSAREGAPAAGASDMQAGQLSSGMMSGSMGALGAAASGGTGPVLDTQQDGSVQGVAGTALPVAGDGAPPAHSFPKPHLAAVEPGPPPVSAQQQQQPTNNGMLASSALPQHAEATTRSDGGSTGGGAGAAVHAHADPQPHVTAHHAPHAAPATQHTPQQGPHPQATPPPAGAPPAGTATGAGPRPAAQAVPSAGPGRSAASSSVGRAGVGAAPGVGPRPGASQSGAAAHHPHHHQHPHSAAGSGHGTPTAAAHGVATGQVQHLARTAAAPVVLSVPGVQPTQAVNPHVPSQHQPHALPAHQSQTHFQQQAPAHQPHAQPEHQQSGGTWQQPVYSYPAFGYAAGYAEQQQAQGRSSWAGSDGSHMRGSLSGGGGGGGGGMGLPQAAGGWGLSAAQHHVGDGMEDVAL